MNKADGREKIIREHYRDNERAANKLVVIISLLFVVMCILNEVTANIDYSPNVIMVNHYVAMPVCVMILSFAALAFTVRFDRPWVKYILMGEMVLMCAASFTAFSTYATYVIIIPIFLTVHYFNKKIIIVVSAITMALFLLAVYLNYSMDSTSEVMAVLHKMGTVNIWASLDDVLCFLVIPLVMLIVVSVFYFLNLTSKGGAMLKAETEFVVKIAEDQAELKTAAVIQQSAVPQGLYKTPGGNFEIAAIEVPAREVGGDFYDYFMAGEDTLCILVADVSDKGVPAALFMMSAKKAIQCAVECCDTLEDSIILANRLICRDNKSNMFLTLWLGTINVKTGIGKYINAGHLCPALRHKDGSITWIENDPDLFLGNFPDENPRVNLFSVEAGDTLFIYTDGVTDATNEAGEFFAIENLEKCVKECSDGAEACCEKVINDVKGFIGSAEQFDDITLMALHCNHIDDYIRSTIEVKAGYEGNETVMDEIERILAGFRKSEAAGRNLKVIIDEVCSNIFEYGYSGKEGQLSVEIVAGANFADLEFRSGGTRFDPTAADDPEFSEEPQFGGLGIYFIKNMADEISYRYEDGQNILKVRVIWNM